MSDKLNLMVSDQIKCGLEPGEWRRRTMPCLCMNRATTDPWESCQTEARLWRRLAAAGTSYPTWLASWDPPTGRRVVIRNHLTAGDIEWWTAWLDLRVTWIHFRGLTWKTYDLTVTTFYFKAWLDLKFKRLEVTTWARFCCEHDEFSLSLGGMGIRRALPPEAES